MANQCFVTAQVVFVVKRQKQNKQTNKQTKKTKTKENQEKIKGEMGIICFP